MRKPPLQTTLCSRWPPLRPYEPPLMLTEAKRDAVGVRIGMFLWSSETAATIGASLRAERRLVVALRL